MRLRTLLPIGLVTGVAVSAPGGHPVPAPVTVEIRSYVLRPDTRAEFHRLVEAEAIPMLRRWNVDVVAWGPSHHDDVSYYLVRAYSSLDHRQASQDAFYGSTEWRDGPRDAILALIDSYSTIVLSLDDAAVDGVRAATTRTLTGPR